MKFFVISDIHGSLKYFKLALERFNNSNCDKLICLGDFYYHGPRNPLPEEYAPKEVSILLNKIKDKVVAIQGNCDAEVDQMISEFSFQKNYTYLNSKHQLLFFHHGHHLVEEPNQYRVIFSGHTHISLLEEKEGIIYANPGSISIPKGDNSRGYFLVDENEITFYDLISNELINKISL